MTVVRWVRTVLQGGVAAFAMLVLSVQAAPLPDKATMAQVLQRAPQRLSVVEPHLSMPDKPVQVDYMGWPAEVVLDSVLGAANWRKPDVDVEFRALDGYVSRIPAERFTQYQAYWVVERVGHATFSVDNLKQNEKAVPLGPYYLVWDNIRSPELVAEGGSFWPYQVADVKVSSTRLQALLRRLRGHPIVWDVADLRSHPLDRDPLVDELAAWMAAR
jgi:hypothetical protein